MNKLIVPHWTCDYEQCPTPTFIGKRCTRCGLNAYCSTACQKRDWKNHKLTCQDMTDKLSREQWSWLTRAKNYIGDIKNENASRKTLWMDSYEAYDKKKERGLVLVQLNDQVKNTKILPEHKTDALLKVNKAFFYHWSPSTNAAYNGTDPESKRFQRAIRLMNTYDPESEFVLMVVCCDEENPNKIVCNVEYILKLYYPLK